MPEEGLGGSGRERAPHRPCHQGARTLQACPCCFRRPEVPGQAAGRPLPSGAGREGPLQANLLLLVGHPGRCLACARRSSVGVAPCSWKTGPQSEGTRAALLRGTPSRLSTGAQPVLGTGTPSGLQACGDGSLCRLEQRPVGRAGSPGDACLLPENPDVTPETPGPRPGSSRVPYLAPSPLVDARGALAGRTLGSRLSTH